MTTEITCPTCGTISHFEELNRDAASFCRNCDFPLFWVRSAQLAAAAGAGGSTGLRRLPGTAGRVAYATIACPSCTEPNPITGIICIRCGADLHPVPVVVPPPPLPEPEPEPEPLPPPPKRVLWPWIVLGAAALVAIILLIILLNN